MPETERSRGTRGASLVGLLMIVLVLGLLSAAAIVGVKSLTDSSNAIGTIVTTTTAPTGSGPAGGTPGPGGGEIAGAAATAAAVACNAAADAARSASNLFLVNSGGSYPVKWSDLTASTPPIFVLSGHDVVARTNPAELDGLGWKLTMSGGGTTAPTFTCS